jgi:cysteine synthase A
VASIGTGGTLIGVYEALSRVHPAVELHAVSPAELPYGSQEPPNGRRKFAGSGGLGCGRKQPFVEAREDRLAGHATFSLNETIREIWRFHEATGLRIGTSSAANLLVARAVARRLGPGSTVVTVFPSAASDEDWSAASS